MTTFVYLGREGLAFPSLRGMGHPACSQNSLDVGSLIYRRVRESNCRFLGSRWSLGMTTFLFGWEGLAGGKVGVDGLLPVLGGGLVGGGEGGDVVVAFCGEGGTGVGDVDLGGG
jgi:hypothetical protein